MGPAIDSAIERRGATTGVDALFTVDVTNDSGVRHSYTFHDNYTITWVVGLESSQAELACRWRWDVRDQVLQYSNTDDLGYWVTLHPDMQRAYVAFMAKEIVT